MPDAAGIHGESHQSLGDRLRAVRESKGLTLDDVAKTTRITKAYLKALEDEDYDKLPSKVYARGFLRCYAAFLDISYEELGPYPSESCSDSATGDSNCAQSGNGAQGVLTLRMFPAVQAVLPFLLVVAVIVLVMVWMFPANKPVREQDVSRPLAKKSAKELSIDSAAPPASTVAVKSSPEKTVSADSVPVLEPAEARQVGLILKLRALSDGALAVTIDEAVTERYVLKTGDNIELKALKYIALDLENAGAVEAELNGKLLNPFGKTGEATRAVLTADQ